VILTCDCAGSKNGMPLLREVQGNRVVARLVSKMHLHLPSGGNGRGF